MRIAICDDESPVIRDLKAKINDYARMQRMDFAVDEYTNAVDLLESPIPYDIVFLDYMMPGLDGMQAARQFREKQDFCIIIFLTSYTDFVFEAFEVNAFRFLRKPLNEEELYNTLEAVRKPFCNKQSIQLKIDRATRSIKVKDIILIEANGKCSIIHMVAETIRYSKTMASVVNLIQGTSFCRVNKAFIINMDYVERYDSDYVYLRKGLKAPIGRKYATTFRTDYLAYMKSRVT